MGVGFRSAVVLLLLTLSPRAALAQCTQPTGFGAFLEALTGIFEQASAKFELTRNGVVYTGQIKVKEATCSSTTIQVRMSGARQQRERGSAGGAGGQADARAGMAVEYELTLPNDRWDDLVPPDPTDPNTIPPGGTMILRWETFVALGLEAQYRALIASSGTEIGAGTVVAITRLPDGRIRIAIGPYEVVRSEGGIAAGGSTFRVGVGRDDKVENGRLRQWTLDPSNPDDLAAYRWIFGQGVALGFVPFTSRPSDRVSYVSYESAAGIRGRAGPFRFSGNWGQSMGDVRVVTRPDGSRTYTGMFNYRGTVLMVTREFDADGNPVGDDRISVTYSGINAWTAYVLRAALGAEPIGSNDFMRRGSQTEDVRIQLRPGEWQTWRDRAREWVRRHPTAHPFLHAIAEAQSEEEVMMALYRATGFGGSTGFADELLQMAMALGTLPGTAVNPCPQAGAPGAGTPGAPGTPNAGAPRTPEQRARDAAQRWCGINSGRYQATQGGTQPAGLAEGAGLANALGRD